MPDKRKSGRTSTLIGLICLIPKLINLAQCASRLICMELRFISKSMILIVIFSIFFGILLSCTWIGMMALFYLYLIQYLSQMVSLSIVLLINILLLIIIGLVILQIRKKMTFSSIREICKNLSA